MSDQVGNVRGCSLLGEIVGEIETLFEQRRYQECLGLIVENLIEAWYGFDPQSLVRIVRQLIFAGADASGAGKAILQFLTSATPSSRRASPPSNRMKFSDLPFDFMEPLGRMVYLRQRGKALEALGVASDLSQSLENLPLFYDSSRGLRQLVYVQSGISAILAGEFEQALKFFTGAQAHRMMPTLPLVARDAYVKAALIHASFGDFAVSKSLLRQAGGFPRTESWAELTIDASESLARIILSVESAECRDVTIPDIPLQHLGEMWPFYVIALQRVLERNGDRAELINRLEGLQQIRFPRVDGEGFAGSVFPLALAAAHAAAGNMSAVRINIALADPNYVGTKLMRMLYEMLLGNAQRVLILSDQSRRHVAFLRQLKLFHVSMTVEAHLVRDELAAARSLLRKVAVASGGLTPLEMAFFSQNVQTVARREVSEWPTSSPTPSNFVNDLPISRVALTARETEILRMLAKGYTRERIASETFVTVNTVKTHVSAIYRKLGVNKRRDAIGRAAVRGLL